eukprot:TRINITY_DN48143_c0_g1_i1.p1 TRINITY_DN48143_c0_g1~~TRINITY_DN48143_c0_g1_i1.p1  ORF type:complete len:540 (-),score=82.66 TRINITY_DN48143_c0_g1_i1:130-1749(-)
MEMFEPARPSMAFLSLSSEKVPQHLPMWRRYPSPTSSPLSSRGHRSLPAVVSRDHLSSLGAMVAATASIVSIAAASPSKSFRRRSSLLRSRWTIRSGMSSPSLSKVAEQEPPSDEFEEMMSELRNSEASKSKSTEDSGEASLIATENEKITEIEEGPVDVRYIERSGQVCVLGVPNSGKSSLVNAMVGAKVSIVSPKPQTTRQRVLGLALVSSRPNASPTTQAVFVDTAGIMAVGEQQVEFGGGSFRHKQRKLFSHSRLHKAMVKTAWKATRDSDAVWWVLDAAKCYVYGDLHPECSELDGVAVGPVIKDAWWSHPELAEEVAFLRRLRKLRNSKVSVVFNKVDLLRDMDADVDGFILEMRERLEKDLGMNEKGEVRLENLWPTSVLHDPDSLLPLKMWLCENMPQQSPIFPVENLSDVPARVLASEITREKLFGVLQKEVPYQITVVNAVWREQPDGRLQLGQKVIARTRGQEMIVKGQLRKISEEIEEEISKTINYGKPVELHFNFSVVPDWEEKEEYYSDLQGLLDHRPSLLFPTN